MNDPVGSRWRRWDLHFHSPASFDYAGGTADAKQLVDRLLDCDVAAVAITDHHTIDVPLIMAMKAYAEERLVIFPGIEFRSEYGGSPVHYIGLFPEDVDLKDVWDTLKGGLGLTPSHLKEKGGDEKIYVPLSDAHAVIVEELGGIISLHAGAKSNSIEEVKNHEQFQRRLKLDLTKQYVDMLEVGQLKDVLDYLEIVFPSTGLELPIIIGSDNHAVHSYTAPPCWIKADPTFIGLRQVLNEPVDRVYLGERPPELRAIEEEPTRFIRSLRMEKLPSSELGEVWFHGTAIEFNQGLVAIVGNQGSGKSALTDILGLLGNCPHQDSFAFLNTDQFLNPKLEKASQFYATLTWADGESVEGNLAGRVPAGAHETIKYIPQFHLDEICDELRGGQGGKFEDELKAVVFSRIRLEEKARRETLDELIDFRTRDARDVISAVREEVAAAAKRYQILESRDMPAYRTSLEQKLALVRQHVKAQRETKPDEMEAPSETEGDGQAELRKELDALTSEIDDLDSAIQAHRKQLAKLNENTETLKQTRASLMNFEQQATRLKEKLASDLEDLDLLFDELVSLKVDYTKLAALEKEFEAERRKVLGALSDEDDASLVSVRRLKLERRQGVQDALNRPAREYAAYQQALQEWERKLAELVGDEDTPDTETFLVKKLEEIKDLPSQLEATRKELRALAEKILNECEGQGASGL